MADGINAVKLAKAKASLEVASEELRELNRARIGDSELKRVLGLTLVAFGHALAAMAETRNDA